MKYIYDKYIYTNTHTHTHLHTHIYTHTYALTHTHTYTQTAIGNDSASTDEAGRHLTPRAQGVGKSCALAHARIQRSGDSSISVTRFIYVCDLRVHVIYVFTHINVTHDVITHINGHTHDVIHLCVWPDPFMCVSHSFVWCVVWLFDVWRDSFACVI